MKIYLDYVFFVNFFFDFILLLGISFLLKRNVSKLKLVLGSIIGGLSGFIIFLNISSFTFFILKLILGFIMIIITFSFKNIKYTMNNFIYLIILSILLGGSLYLFNLELSKILNLSINNKLYIIVLLIVSILVISIYTIYIKRNKKYLDLKHTVRFNINNKKYNLIGYLDTGNNLLYKKRPVIILNKDIRIDLKDKFIYQIPITTLNKVSLLKSVKLKEVFINEKKYKNIYLGISNDKFHLQDVDIILNNNMEDL